MVGEKSGNRSGCRNRPAGGGTVADVMNKLDGDTERDLDTGLALADRRPGVLKQRDRLLARVDGRTDRSVSGMQPGGHANPIRRVNPSGTPYAGGRPCRHVGMGAIFSRTEAVAYGVSEHAGATGELAVSVLWDRMPTLTKGSTG